MAIRSIEERLVELDEKMNQIKAQKRALQNKTKAEERKKRTHRLIEVGAVVEKYVGEINDLTSFEKYIQQYNNAIKATQKITSPEQ